MTIRASVDWAAAGRKAWATRLRNLAAGGAGKSGPARRVRTVNVHVTGRTAAALKAWATRRENSATPMPTIVVDDPQVHRQVRRILDSMQAFGFDSFWQSHDERHGCETGHSHRVAGDPIYHTIGQVAGVEASRAETIEAITAVAEGRRPNLPPRMALLPSAVASVAAAIAAGRRMVSTELGAVRIEGPMLPPNWDEVMQ